MKVMNVQYLHGKPLSSGTLKSIPEDFVVKEDLGFELDGEGEHVMVRVEKQAAIHYLLRNNWQSLLKFQHGQ